MEKTDNWELVKSVLAVKLARKGYRVLDTDKCVQDLVDRIAEPELRLYTVVFYEDSELGLLRDRIDYAVENWENNKKVDGEDTDR